MATNTLFTTIVLRNDTAANWTSANPILVAGEMGVENDTGKFKIGNGVAAWNSLPYSTTEGDATTLESTPDGKLRLRNWGVRYYAWVAAESRYELTQVDETHPWPAGLTPRSAANGEIEWYAPSDITVEGLQTSIENLQNAIGTSTDTQTSTLWGLANSKIGPEGGTLTGALVLADGSEAASKTYVENQIASAGHLKRVVVEVLPQPSEADPNTIYMVLVSSILSGDKYQEYMLIDGAMVQIGDTTVDLSSYATKEALETHATDTTIHITEQERTNWNSVKEVVDAMPNIKTIGAGLALEDNGTLVVDKVNVQKIFVETGDTLILNGGGAD